MTDFKTVGQPVIRIDGADKVTGAAQYVDDLDFGPGLLHAAIVESPHAHALIKKIDISQALQVPGVVKIVTGEDFPYTFGLYMKDRFIFARDRVRFVGEQVAAVVARDARSAQQAQLAELINARDRLVRDRTDAPTSAARSLCPH